MRVSPSKQWRCPNKRTNRGVSRRRVDAMDEAHGLGAIRLQGGLSVSILTEYFYLVQNTIGWRLILCLILYCLPGLFHGGLGPVQCISFAVPTYLMHLGSRDNSERQKRCAKISNWSPGSRQSLFTPVRSHLGERLSSSPRPPRPSFDARDVDEAAPPTQ